MKEVNLELCTEKELKNIITEFKREWTDLAWSDYKFRVISYMELVKNLYGIDNIKYKTLEKIWKIMIEVQEDKT